MGIDKTVTEKTCRKVFKQKKSGSEVIDPTPKKMSEEKTDMLKTKDLTPKKIMNGEKDNKVLGKLN